MVVAALYLAPLVAFYSASNARLHGGSSLVYYTRRYLCLFGLVKAEHGHQHYHRIWLTSKSQSGLFGISQCNVRCVVLFLQSGILDAPDGSVNYLTAAAGPSTCYVARKFCSVCGYIST